MMTSVAMLSRESRRWGYRDDNDGKEGVVEVDDHDETIVHAVLRRRRRTPPPHAAAARRHRTP